ncbi:nucleotidyltransferase family protein [Humisphaera borealis]|uniref:Nucleotidyltransferase family protein n=1 Tax=Humisphaera borealis TaxID=2807512 RepID=A0A7M2WZ16_9BACT|nr:hypothetical protein [Humisphaera borealis]QOV90679.1 hypothetical protein IPV69_04790 [Humisphaera borealis]
MTSQDFMWEVVQALDRAKVPYMVVGSLSSNVYGIPRSTKDADFVVELRDVPIGAIADQLGPGYLLDSQMSFETVTGTYRWKIRHIDSAFQIELFLISEDPHDRERFLRRRKVKYNGNPVFVATAEDVVITKLRWSRQGKRAKDLDDVRSVLTVSGENLDWEYIHRWCAIHKTESILSDVRKSVPT